MGSICLADVGVLGGIQVTLYNGATPVQQLNVNDALVNLSLLSGNRFNAIFEAKSTYDRVLLYVTSGNGLTYDDKIVTDVLKPLYLKLWESSESWN